MRIDPVATEKNPNGTFQPMVQRGDGPRGRASDEMLDFVIRLLRYEDAERPSAKMAREHVWFRMPTDTSTSEDTPSSSDNEGGTPNGRTALINAGTPAVAAEAAELGINSEIR